VRSDGLFIVDYLLLREAASGPDEPRAPLRFKSVLLRVVECQTSRETGRTLRRCLIRVNSRVISCYYVNSLAIVFNRLLFINYNTRARARAR